MATSGSELPTYEALRAAGQRIYPSVDFLRLRWYFKGPIEASIHVLEDATNSTSPQSPYQTTVTTTSPDGQTTINIQEHEISSSSITEPPVSSITVTIEELDDWGWKWVEAHRPEESESAVYINDEPGGEPRVVQCCGEDRPYLHSPVPSLLIKASGESKPFVTIHDFVTVVHPWMTALDADIRRSRGVYRVAPLSRNVNMFIHNSVVNPLRVSDELGKNPASIAAGWRGVAGLAAKIKDRTSPAQ
ncbi:hypothetical protein AAE478_000324 [Parahypoxylon ruwenzoriense]